MKDLHTAAFDRRDFLARTGCAAVAAAAARASLAWRWPRARARPRGKCVFRPRPCNSAHSRSKRPASKLPLWATKALISGPNISNARTNPPGPVACELAAGLDGADANCDNLSAGLDGCRAGQCTPVAAAGGSVPTGTVAILAPSIVHCLGDPCLCSTSFPATDWFGKPPTRSRIARNRTKYLDRADAAELQEQTLLKLVARARDTRFGSKHDFRSIRTIADYQARVPVRKYEAFWREYWQPEYPHLDNITWPGRIPYYALSSGTTSGTTKEIPNIEGDAQVEQEGGLYHAGVLSISFSQDAAAQWANFLSGRQYADRTGAGRQPPGRPERDRRHRGVTDSPLYLPTLETAPSAIGSRKSRLWPNRARRCRSPCSAGCRRGCCCCSIT